VTGQADAQITFLPASDLAASRAFYEGVLGLPLVVDQGVCLIFRATGDAFLGVCEHLDGIDGRSVIVTLVTDDVDGWCDRIRAHGGELASGPEHNDRFGIYHAFVLDPDGNHVEIQRFDDTEWASPARRR
jgi:catechol 2,3-dioxygenase-like lactoylglutathione lyase family enzyme